MSHSLLLALIAFGAVMAFTPGPNNIMVLSSGLTYGFRRSLPHIAGIAFGIAFMVAAIGLGLGAVFVAWPILQTILKYAGIAYLIYLAWVDRDVRTCYAGAGQPGGPDDLLGRGAVPVGQRQGLGDGDRHHYRLFGGGQFPWNIAMQAALMFIMGALSSLLWALFGSALRPVLTSPKAVRAFNIVMALLLLASLYPVLMDA